ncbi:hypothetical protein WJX72_000713 [[Myrmecia] bisecta]|uniref:Uncharacterized protein n=1 Tax=[Myrmecia] bisecta TaxID=41462 RepID=A0AAW1R482_9CHLO
MDNTHKTPATQVPAQAQQQEQVEPQHAGRNNPGQTPGEPEGRDVKHAGPSQALNESTADYRVMLGCAVAVAEMGDFGGAFSAMSQYINLPLSGHPEEQTPAFKAFVRCQGSTPGPIPACIMSEVYCKALAGYSNTGQAERDNWMAKMRRIRSKM